MQEVVVNASCGQLFATFKRSFLTLFALCTLAIPMLPRSKCFSKQRYAINLSTIGVYWYNDLVGQFRYWHQSSNISDCPLVYTIPCWGWSVRLAHACINNRKANILCLVILDSRWLCKVWHPWWWVMRQSVDWCLIFSLVSTSALITSHHAYLYWTLFTHAYYRYHGLCFHISSCSLPFTCQNCSLCPLSNRQVRLIIMIHIWPTLISNLLAQICYNVCMSAVANTTTTKD